MGHQRRPISDLEIQQDIVFGPGRGPANPFMNVPGNDQRNPQMMPLVRIEF